jgi:HNH endonuclease
LDRRANKRRRGFSPAQRRVLAFVSGGVCSRCGKQLPEQFHADHVLPWSRGGRTITTNGAALCPRCNLIKGNRITMPKLPTFTPRAWQTACLDKAWRWLVTGTSDRHFLISAVTAGALTPPLAHGVGGNISRRHAAP